MALFRLEFKKPGTEFRLLKSRLANPLKLPAQGDLMDKPPRRETLNALVWKERKISVHFGGRDEVWGGGGGGQTNL